MSGPRDTIDRREALRRMAGGAAGLGLGLSALSPTARAQDRRRPNILFVLIDDLRWDAASFMGHPFLRTPGIDRIAGEGAVFRNAFVTTSLCSPSRASFLSGAHAHRHGVRVNDTMDPLPGVDLFPSVLQDSGYETAFIGKWHQRPVADPRPGFDKWLSFVGQGTYLDPELNEDGRPFTAEGYMTDILNQYALEWLGARGDQPWCLTLSHKAVHGPFTPPERHADLFADVEIPEPESWDEDFSDKPEWMRRALAYGARREQWLESEGAPIPEAIPAPDWDPTQKARLDYYRSILAIDEGLVRILDLLEGQGQLDDTLVLFTSDNGMFWGEHRRGDKRLMYEESIRIPMVARYPALIDPGTTVDEMVLNIDVAPTFLDVAGAEIPGTVQGESVTPLLTGEEVPWRDSFLYEYFREDWLPGIPTTIGVRTEDWKLITYPEIDDTPELYNLEADPHELHSLALDPAHASKLAELRAELERLKEKTRFGDPIRRYIRRRGDLVLHYDFDGATAAGIRDRSSTKAHGTLEGGDLLLGGAFGGSVRLKGDGGIAVPMAEALDPSMKPLTIIATVRADSPDGVILARGGQSHGYALHVQGGKPVFTLRQGGSIASVVGEREITGEWVELTGVLTGACELALYVDGEEVARGQSRYF
ncbi:MAG: sulfatase-like hydrolase/transferase, partial [Armatimonadia bacterium]|nr:sulfatase-like hydrolase/transferase [Armatimonadia bacterium]